MVLLLLAIDLQAQNWIKVWSDEFNTPGLPDSTKWSYEVGMIRNNELQYYTDKRFENARIDDTTLVIEALKETQFGNGSTCTSASLISQRKGDWKYGKIEVSAKIPTGKGTWPAIWMMPTNSEYGGWAKSGEIDIMENIGFKPNDIYFTCHYEGIDGSGHGSSGTNRAFSQPYSKFLKYAIIWSPEKIEWYVDDVLYHTYRKTDEDHKVWPFNKEFYLILNLAIGGDWGGQQGIDYALFPKKFYIDYVRVYQLKEGNAPYTLTVPIVHGGKVKVIPRKRKYACGEQVTLTAIPDKSYSFKNWLYWGGTNPITLTMYKNITIEPVFEKRGELIKNGDFSQGLRYWKNIYISDKSTMEVTSNVEKGVYNFIITKPGSAWWHLGNQQLAISVVGGKTYQLTFEAWSSNPGQLGTSLSKNYGDYSTYLDHFCELTSSKQTFTWEFTPPTTDSNCRLFFGVGNFPAGRVYLDNISLVEVFSSR